MPEAATNTYKVDRRAIDFTLYEHLHVEQLFEHERYAHLSRAECDAVIDQCARFVTEVTGPLNGAGRPRRLPLRGRHGAHPGRLQGRLEQALRARPGVVRHAARRGRLRRAARRSRSILQELQSGANTAFNMYPGLTHGAADVIQHFALARGQGALPAAHAGGPLRRHHVPLGAARRLRRRAPRRPGRSSIEGNLYAISGTKCWISAGDHDLAENIIHLVLARIEGAPAGTKGLSLFIVPKVWVNDDGSLGEPNDVATGSIEHKLGIKASATAVLNFGENGACRGILVGGQQHQGIKQMFRMMNSSRIAVGIQGVAVASTAYLNALGYARERLQGSSVRHFKDPSAPRVPIIEHADVRRMLLEMKAKVEGMRTLAVKLALHSDLALALEKSDPAKAHYHQGQVDLLTPIVKAYCADQAFRIAELAIQTYGGAGFVMDHPVEQYCRDAKIFSIYEGTNHIQAADLVARKLQANGGESFAAFLGEIERFVREYERQPGIGNEVRALGEALEALKRCAGALMEYFMGGKVDQVTLCANAVPRDDGRGDDRASPARGRGHRRRRSARAIDDEQSEEDDFYEGKVAAAKFFVNFILPGVHAKTAVIVGADRSALDVPDRGFSTVA